MSHTHYLNYLTATADAQTAVYAAKNICNWGAYAAQAYCVKRGISLKLYSLACRLQLIKDLEHI